MLAPLALLIAAACGGGSNPKSPELSNGDPVPNLDGGGARAWQARPAIVQTLKLLNPGLRTGDTLKLESTLRNVSNAPVDITHVVCELDLEGIETMSPLILCFAYSIDGKLAPGEEVTSRLQRIITSPAGKYTIRVRHLLNPDVWVPAELTVQPR
jgi:hypothetical protein